MPLLLLLPLGLVALTIALAPVLALTVAPDGNRRGRSGGAVRLRAPGATADARVAAGPGRDRRRAA